MNQLRQKEWKRAAQTMLLSIVLLFSLMGNLTNPVKAAPSGLDPSRITLVPVISGLNQPLLVTNAGDGSGRLFIGERAGVIRIIKNGRLNATPFLDIDNLVDSTAGERGLLALAFHPDYETNGYFYTVHTNSSGSLVLSRFTASPPGVDQVNSNSRMELLVIPHPNHANHNGGTLVFGPDHYLYWSTGDGGGAGDPNDNAQNLSSLLGKILRLDVDSASPYAIPPTNPYFNNANTSVRKEIWAYGLRNPWRISFDRGTGDLYIGDVGQGAREEIDYQPAGSAGGINYGWNIMEGSLCYNATTCNKNGLTLPVAEYSHTFGCSVTGGHVYRGSSYPALQGHYLYGDFCSGILFDLHYSQATGWVSTQLLDTSYNITTFGESESGELYLVDYSQGVIYQITYDETIFADVPLSNPYRTAIETIYVNKVTSGCNTSPLMYCPTLSVTRAQMAVFLLRTKHGSTYTPPAATGDFADVPTNYWAAAWIEQLAAEGITSGCATNPARYCPESPVTRDQMAVFLLTAKHGSTYKPPAATGDFADVPTNYWAAAWIEQLAAEGITSGCATNPARYCPTTITTRDQMAVFLVTTFDLTIP